MTPTDADVAREGLIIWLDRNPDGLLALDPPPEPNQFLGQVALQLLMAGLTASGDSTVSLDRLHPSTAPVMGLLLGDGWAFKHAHDEQAEASHV